MSETAAYQGAKLWLMGLTGLPKDTLHVYLGLAVFFGAALLLRWPVRSWKPLAAVAVVALAGEAWDLRDSWAMGWPIDLGLNGHDLWNTCFWPLVVMLLARFTRVFRG